ncbi:MAG: hypothetical protein ACREOI_15050 [bacterium]
MEDTPVVQQIVQRVEKRGIEKGIEKGIPLGIQQILLEQIAARFGVVPEEIRQKIQSTNNTDNLKRITTLLLTIQSVDELKDLVN